MSAFIMSWNCRRSENNLPGTLCSYSLVSLCVGGVVEPHKPQKHIIRTSAAPPQKCCKSEIISHAAVRRFVSVNAGRCILERQMNYLKMIDSLVRMNFSLTMHTHGDFVFHRSQALPFVCSFSPGNQLGRTFISAAPVISWFWLQPCIKWTSAGKRHQSPFTFTFLHHAYIYPWWILVYLDII